MTTEIVMTVVADRRKAESFFSFLFSFFFLLRRLSFVFIISYMLSRSMLLKEARLERKASCLFTKQSYRIRNLSNESLFILFEIKYARSRRIYLYSNLISQLDFRFNLPCKLKKKTNNNNNIR